MGRTARRRQEPPVRPVQKIELSDKHIKARTIAAAIFLVLGVTALAFAFNEFMSAGEGWTQIEVSSNDVNCGGDFTLLYNLGASGVSARSENRGLVSVYSDAAVTAYRLFTTDQGFEDVNNVYYLNRHPNEVVEVDSVLYRAFELLRVYGDRSIYLGPAYSVYDNIFFCTEDYQLADFDPLLNEDIRELFGEIAAFARDESSIELELLGENKVRLSVSQAYLAFMEREELTDFIDFYWMTNAFIADYLAERLVEAGYTYGSLSSTDGFIRNLDDQSDLVYGFNLYDRQGQVVYPAAVLQYTGRIAIAYLRDYPSGAEFERYYVLENGETRVPYLSLENALPAAATDSLVGYSETLGCAEMALSLAPIYAAENLDTRTLETLSEAGVETIYAEDLILRCTDPNAVIADIMEPYTLAK